MGPLLTELAEQSRPVLRNGSDPIEGHTTRPMFAIQSSKPNRTRPNRMCQKKKKLITKPKRPSNSSGRNGCWRSPPGGNSAGGAHPRMRAGGHGARAPNAP